MTDRKYDFIIFGATGFTGKHTISQAHRFASDLKWAVAGRSETKLKAVLAEMEKVNNADFSKISIITASVDDQSSLNKMTEQAKVIINTVGPYQLYGEPVVKACIESRTHHVDVTGEFSFTKNISEKYGKLAEERGVYIVHACGFDSVPNELGVKFVEKSFEGTLNSIETYMDFEFGESDDTAYGNIGTLETMLREARAMKVLGFYPGWKDLAKKLKPEHKMKILSYCSYNDKRAVVFPGLDRVLLQQSQLFNYEHYKKRPIQVHNYFTLKTKELVILGIWMIFISILTFFDFGLNLVVKHPYFFTGGYFSREGPSEKNMKNVKFNLFAVGLGWDRKLTNPLEVPNEKPNKEIVVKVSGENPAYGATTLALLFSAVMLIKEADKIPVRGGTLSPAVAFGNTSYIENLNKNGFTFEVISQRQI